VYANASQNNMRQLTIPSTASASKSYACSYKSAQDGNSFIKAKLGSRAINNYNV